MCYPALIPLAMAAAGAGANYAAQKKVVGAREDVAKAEGERQDAFQRQATNVIDENLTKQSPAAQNQALAMAGEQRTSALLPSQTDGASLPTSGSAPIEVKGEVARQMSDAIRSGRSRLGAQARLGAFNQNQDSNQRQLRAGMSGLAQLSDLSRGSTGVLPYELAGAANAGRGWKTAADLFNLGAQATSTYQQVNGAGGASSGPTFTDPTDPGFSRVGGYSPVGSYSPAPRRPVSLLGGGGY